MSPVPISEPSNPQRASLKPNGKPERAPKQAIEGLPSIFDLTRSELAEAIAELGEPAYRGKQIWKALYAEGVTSFDEITTLPRLLRDRLTQRYRLDPLTPVMQRKSNDGLVEKTLFRLDDGELIETVLMRYDSRGGSRARRTACISTQAGCALGCTFCATGQQGFRRQLTVGEIAAQVLHVNRRLAAQAKPDEDKERVTNVVFMGMGEPFANYDNTMGAVGILNDSDGVRLGARHMTISTVGLVPQILKLADEPYQINLAISLHAPNDKIRSQTMPINRRYPIARLMRACRTYISKTNRRISFEYVLLAGENDRLEHAEELADLLKGMLCHVNLIPVNATDAVYTRPPDGRIGKFRDILKRSGIAVTVRFEKGTDIDAGCGQLRARALTGAD
ncbi:MAG: 23S rRNA (adenine(2503)-C(2))-methyltransferase RlmN [Chloroflexi bacterium]|nr:23S rRNA (adenine(2503)-C(2))-methyltransferase RlmN [Chloroflexota bacterium]